MSNYRNSTSQQSIGKAIIVPHDSGNRFMVWTGTNNAINLNRQSNGDYVFTSTPQGSYKSKYGPAFVLMPNERQGYVVWTDFSTGQVLFGLAEPPPFSPTSKVPLNWFLSNSTVIAGSNAAGGPSAALGMQNNKLVLNVIWQDVGKNSMVLSQIPLDGNTSPKPFTSLGQSCIDSPWLAEGEESSFLAYFDSNNNFNLATDLKGGMDFDFGKRFTSDKIKSAFSPTFVPISGDDQAYVFWSTKDGVQYRQLGIGLKGYWAINPSASTFGALTKTLPAAGPFADLVDVLENGISTRKLLVAWPDKNGTPGNTIYTDNVEPNYEPIPIQV